MNNIDAIPGHKATQNFSVFSVFSGLIIELQILMPVNSRLGTSLPSYFTVHQIRAATTGLLRLGRHAGRHIVLYDTLDGYFARESQ